MRNTESTAYTDEITAFENFGMTDKAPVSLACELMGRLLLRRSYD